MVISAIYSDQCLNFWPIFGIFYHKRYNKHLVSKHSIHSFDWTFPSLIIFLVRFYSDIICLYWFLLIRFIVRNVFSFRAIHVFLTFCGNLCRFNEFIIQELLLSSLLLLDLFLTLNPKICLCSFHRISNASIMLLLLIFILLQL